MGVIFSEESVSGLASAMRSSLSATAISVIEAFDGLCSRRMGRNETDISRFAKTLRRADTRFSTKGQRIVRNAVVMNAPASCAYATSCLKATDLTRMFEDT